VRLLGSSIFNTQSDNQASLGQSSVRWSTAYAYTFDLKTGLNHVANATVGATVAGNDAAGFNWTHTGGKGGPASATAGGVGGAIQLTAGLGGDGAVAKNPGNGGPLNLYAGDGGTGGTGNASGGSVTVDAGNKSGTGTQGLIHLGRSGAAVALSVTFNTGRRTVFRSVSDAATNIVSTDETVILASATAGRTFTLPATHVAGQRFNLINASNQTLTIGRNGNKIDGNAADATQPALTAGTPNCRVLVSNGTDWWTLGRN
jgi:hypothetical protein